jgi:hypothetical protein
VCANLKSSKVVPKLKEKPRGEPLEEQGKLNEYFYTRKRRAMALSVLITSITILSITSNRT